MSLLCLTLCRNTLAANLEDLKMNTPHMAELRIDLLDPPERKHISDFPARAGIPLILTCRKKADGGEWSGTDSERESLLLAAMAGDFDYMDLEEDETSRRLVAEAEQRNTRIIRSFHDFKGVPSDLMQRLEAMSLKGDLVKAAVMPRGIADLLTLFKTGRQWREENPGKNNLILLGMGAFGVPSRILAQRCASFLTFCSPAGAEAAPGHMSRQTLEELYRVPEIDDDTQIFGIIGNPVLHTRSPHIHNPGFQDLGINAVYVPFTVDDVSAFFELADFLDIRGFSTTVPHKLAVREHLDREDEAVQAVSSCNTVVRSRKGWEGFNTDVEGFLRPLISRAGVLNGKTAAVIGAGGAARAVVYALVREGCRVSIFNRTESRAAALASEMGCSGYSLDKLRAEMDEGERYDIVVQTSSVGMHGTEGPSNPVPFYRFTGSELVYDIIYTPPVTEIMQRALDAGAAVLGGMPMLREQAFEQFLLFTGAEYPRKSSGMDQE
ncbi:MAG: shikimate dehydrogenase [Spirochaetales bacterium]|nr:shikimate dehydrogenase [Spirochaetales bacterium]